MPKQLGKYWVSKVEAHSRKGCTVYEGCEDPTAITQDASFADMDASIAQGRSVRRDSTGASASPPTARIKVYDREDVSLPDLSANIKLQESLARRRFQLRQRYAQLYADRHGADPAAVAAALLQRGSHGLSLESGIDPLEVTTSAGLELPSTRDLSDDAVPFLYLCAEHVLLLKDKMQSRTKVILIRDWMPDSMLSVIAHGRLPEEGAFFFFFQLLQAVYFLHENQLAHRNISAEHLHLTADGAVLRLGGMSSAVHIPDNAVGAPTAVPPPGSYGICSHCGNCVPIAADATRQALPSAMAASSLHGSSASTSTTTTTATTTTAGVNTLMTTCPRCGVQQNRMQLLRTLTGSPGYLAPEVLVYRPPASSLMSSQVPTSTGAPGALAASPALGAGRRSALADAQARDMWSCGVVLYFMLTATLPFDPVGATGGAQADFRRTPEQIDETCTRIVTCQYQIPDFVSEPARQLIAGLLQRDPAQRPTAAQAMAYSCLAPACATLTAGM